MPLNIPKRLFDLTNSSIRNTSIKINILNYQFQTVNEISGNVISGNLTIDANADVRRTCNVSLAVTDSSFEVQPGGQIWLDKYIQIFTGIKDIITDDIEWVNRGIYLIESPNWEYDGATNTLTFSGLDLMSKMTGIRNGYLPGIPTVIPQGSNIRNSMISTITQLGGFSKYLIEENPQTVPYDINIERGGVVYDILKELRDITPNYEIFFDVDGVFVYRKIPSGENEPVDIDDTTWKNVVIQESVNVDFDSVKNVVEVWGKSHNPQYFGGTATVSGNVYKISVTGVTSYQKNILYGFIAPSVISDPYCSINNLNNIKIVDSKGNAAIIPESGKYYILMYQSNGTFLFLGNQQVYGRAEDNNPQSPFYINSSIGSIRLVCYSGEYDNIWSDELARERANYELWLHTRMNDSIDIRCVPVPFADVNIVVNYTQRNTEVPTPYIIKSISEELGVDGTQSINMIRYYPLYPSNI